MTLPWLIVAALLFIAVVYLYAKARRTEQSVVLHVLDIKGPLATRALRGRVERVIGYRIPLGRLYVMRQAMEHRGMIRTYTRTGSDDRGPREEVVWVIMRDIGRIRHGAF